MACQSTALWLRIAGGISAVATLAGALLNPDRKRVTESVSYTHLLLWVQELPGSLRH